MSGGSFNYLYTKDFAIHADSLDQMAEILESLGCSDAGGELRKASSMLRDADVIRQEMNDVIRAVEYYRSGDYGEETLKREVDDWRSFTVITTPGAEEP